MKLIVLGFLALFAVSCSNHNHHNGTEINRKAVVGRNNPKVHAADTLASLSVGNGNFAFTADITGLQTFPGFYAHGVPLGTQSQWGWHSMPNPKNLLHNESLKAYDLGHGQQELYAVQFKEDGRAKEAADYYRQNLHRIHLGCIGFELPTADGQALSPGDLKEVNQELDLWNGRLYSSFKLQDKSVAVETACDPHHDKIAATVKSPLLATGALAINLRFPYPTAQHSDDACDWNAPQKHQTTIAQKGAGFVVLKRSLDTTTYYIKLHWEGGEAAFAQKAPHHFVLTAKTDSLAFSAQFTPGPGQTTDADIAQVRQNSSNYWQQYWLNGGMVDFGDCQDKRAPELERRVILSQYLMAIQCAGNTPPQETGLTYNSWYGKFHLEMHWWHAVHFALWGRPQLMERSMAWYQQVAPIAEQIAQRQGFDGVRWMKMTDIQGTEAPSKVGSFLIWQQPHFIYMAELLYRKDSSRQVLDKYKGLVFKTADFMASFATLDSAQGRYVLKGIIPAQETLRAAETTNPPFELSYWHYGLSVAQLWRERTGLERNKKWDDILDRLSPLAQKDGLYLAAETAPQTYEDIRFTSDHMAVLGAYGILPQNHLFCDSIMARTLNWIWDNWNWDKTWGWDYPMTAMCAARLGHSSKAVDALLTTKRTNTYLVNGHNYQDDRLRVYLPGNGGLLTTIAMMCAGWDGSQGANPGFPQDGNWNVRWEGLAPMP